MITNGVKIYGTPEDATEEQKEYAAKFEKHATEFKMDFFALMRKRLEAAKAEGQTAFRAEEAAQGVILCFFALDLMKQNPAFRQAAEAGVQIRFNSQAEADAFASAKRGQG